MAYQKGCLLAGVLAVALLLVPSGFAQPLPVMVYGGTFDDRATALVEGSDPGYCLAGWSRSFSAGGPSDVLIVKTDQMGVPVWSVKSLGADDDEAYSMVRTHDAGYAVTGWTKSHGVGSPSRSIFALKLTQAGLPVWGWVYGGAADDEAYSIVETMDNGFAITGLTHSFGPSPYPNIFVLRLDGQGMPVWMRVYWNAPGHVEDEGYAIIQTPDTGYAVVGRAKTLGPVLFNPFVMKLDQLGNIQWVQTMPGESDDDEGYSVDLDLQANILAGGWTRSFGTSPTLAADMFVAQFALGGGPPIWSWSYGWPAGDEEAVDDRSLTATTDGGSAVCGPTTSVGPGIPNPNFLVLKLDPGGMPMWCRSHPSPHDPGLLNDVPRPMVELGPGGYGIAGWTNSFPHLGGEDFHLLTLDASGNRPICVEPQEPLVESLPWMDWAFEDTLVRPELDSFPVEATEVLFHPICEETTAVREAGDIDPARGMELYARGNNLELITGRSGIVSVTLYSAAGRREDAVADRRFAAGRHLIVLPELKAGVYLARAVRGGCSATVKVVRF